MCVLSVLPLATAACDGVGASSSQRAATGGRWSAPMPIRGVRSLAAVSCATRSLCVAVGGRVAVSDHRGVWSAPATIDARAGVNDGLVTVSCASPRFCLAADAAGRVIRFDGTSWSKPATVDRAGLSEISCVSLRFCGAVDQAGEALFFNGSAWSAPSAPRRSPAGRDCLHCRQRLHGARRRRRRRRRREGWSLDRCRLAGGLHSAGRLGARQPERRGVFWARLLRGAGRLRRRVHVDRPAVVGPVPIRRGARRRVRCGVVRVRALIMALDGDGVVSRGRAGRGRRRMRSTRRMPASPACRVQPLASASPSTVAAMR